MPLNGLNCPQSSLGGRPQSRWAGQRTSWPPSGQAERELLASGSPGSANSALAPNWAGQLAGHERLCLVWFVLHPSPSFRLECARSKGLPLGRPPLSGHSRARPNKERDRWTRAPAKPPGRREPVERESRPLRVQLALALAPIGHIQTLCRLCGC